MRKIALHFSPKGAIQLRLKPGFSFSVPVSTCTRHGGDLGIYMMTAPRASRLSTVEPILFIGIPFAFFSSKAEKQPPSFMYYSGLQRLSSLSWINTYLNLTLLPCRLWAFLFILTISHLGRQTDGKSYGKVCGRADFVFLSKFLSLLSAAMNHTSYTSKDCAGKQVSIQKHPACCSSIALMPFYLGFFLLNFTAFYNTDVVATLWQAFN